jgi:hypothetical protein
MAVATTREEILNQRYPPAEPPVLQEIPDEWDDEDD